MAACRDCGAPIRFVRVLPDFRAMPIDPLPDTRGNVYAWQELTGWFRGSGHPRHRWVAIVLVEGASGRAGIEAALNERGRTYANTQRYMPHAATCGGRPRPTKPRPTATAEDTLF